MILCPKCQARQCTGYLTDKRGNLQVDEKRRPRECAGGTQVVTTREDGCSAVNYCRCCRYTWGEQAMPSQGTLGTLGALAAPVRLKFKV